MNLHNMILIDIEPITNVKSSIYEVALMIIENNEPIDEYHFEIVKQGDKKYFDNEEFKNILNQYKYPLVAYEAVYCRKFLLHYKWIKKDYEFYDAKKSIDNVNNDLLSSPALGYFSFNMQRTNVATEDVKLLWKLLETIQPVNWIFVKDSSKKNLCSHRNKYSYVIKHNYQVIKDTFYGKIIVFTGKGKIYRNDLMQLAKKCGANVSNTITRKTDILVVGAKAGSKVQKAKKQGIQIMSMNEFYQIIKNIPLDGEVS